MSSTEVIRLLEAAGWKLVRTKGSHHHFKKDGERHRSTPTEGPPDRHASQYRARFWGQAHVGSVATMHYDALVTKDGENFLIEFPDAPGCQTFAEKSDEVLPLAQEAIEGWLEANLVERRVPPKPERRRAAPMGYSLLRVPVNPVLAVALQVRWERLKRGLSQGDLAALVKVSQQAVAKIEDPDGNPTLDTIQKVAEALDMHVTLSLDALNPFIANATVRSSAEQGIAGKRAVPDVATSRRDARKNRPKQVRRTSPTRR